MMWAGLYTLGIRFYLLGIHLAALFYPKARKWLRGRKNQFIQPLQKADGRMRIWFHCASLGEFEQGRPLIEAIKAVSPQSTILLSFFSPSGYDIRKNYTLADQVVYLPPDLPGQVRRFLDSLQPDVAIFVKYEFWHNYLQALQNRHIPYYFISAVFRPSQLFFRPWGHWFRKQLAQASHIFVQDASSLRLLHEHGLNNASHSGDTRYDRVSAHALRPPAVPLLSNFGSNALLIVAGSTWPQDERLLLHLKAQTGLPIRFIIAPHEVDDKRVNGITSAFGPDAMRYSQIQDVIPTNIRVIIIDNIGMLAGLYALADIAYVGGAFGSGLHNILEPAAHGKPVVFGPHHHRFPEAAAMIQEGGGFSVRDQKQWTSLVREWMADPVKRQQAGQAARLYVEIRRGATDRIMKHMTRMVLK